MGFLFCVNSTTTEIQGAFGEGVFGKKVELFQACLGTGVIMVTPWKKFNFACTVDTKLESSQGYEQSSACEFYTAFYYLAVRPVVGYLEKFEDFYKKIPPKKKISASVLMILSLLTDEPVKAVESFQKLIEDCQDQEDAMLFFHEFYKKCKEQYGSSSLLMQYIDAQDENPGDEQEKLMIAYLQKLAAANSGAKKPDQAE